MAKTTNSKRANGRRRALNWVEREDRDEQVHLALVGIRAAVQVAVTSLSERPGPDQAMAVMLTRGALNELDGIMQGSQS